MEVTAVHSVSQDFRAQAFTAQAFTTPIPELMAKASMDRAMAAGDTFPEIASGDQGMAMATATDSDTEASRVAMVATTTTVSMVADTAASAASDQDLMAFQDPRTLGKGRPLLQHPALLALVLPGPVRQVTRPLEANHVLMQFRQSYSRLRIE